ncbi:YjfA family protein [Streptomyces sp. NPDC003758]|uniref:YjfA family protein n=1 Tax=Streptomyces cynarae TaxID=2981134 RepID=A0ABY6E2Y1_9ACTN|nr:YjfA family protein [Streptomyces cynarae]UXY20171.1 YjfA family protein [Streptomyces cynarae]
MRTTKRALARAGVVAGGLGLAMIAATGGAQAYTYDGSDPSSTGCSSGATTVESATVKNSNATFGTIELRYSLACHTAWARLTLNYTQGACGNASAGYACANAEVIRNNDGRTYSCTIYQGQSQCYTPMVYDKGMTSFAQGAVDTALGTVITRTAAY